jgi:AcrR family transcriptional regulator
MSTISAAMSTREKLLAATLELVAEGGYGSASVLAITERAGVAAGTLYRHFARKEDLFVELFREVCSREVEAMREATVPYSDPLDRLDAAIETFARRALENQRVAWALLAEPVDPAVDAERLAYRLRYRDLVAALLEEAADQGAVERSDTELLAAAIVGGVGEALVGPLASEVGAARPATDQLIAEILAFSRRAAGARKAS